MKIVKKDGRLEEFDVRKIKTSIENAANDCDAVLNESDLKILVSDVENTLKNIRKDSFVTSSYEVIGVIFDVLKKDGFNKVIKAYVEFDK
jgi:transcriptional repressor NrdR